VELAPARRSHIREGGVNAMHVNKVSHVKTINLVAKELGEDVDTLHDVALEMEPEDGLIWVHGLDDEGVIAFTEFGVESLIELLQIHREQPNPKT
jgi:hypothetical protein